VSFDVKFREVCQGGCSSAILANIFKAYELDCYDYMRWIMYLCVMALCV